MHIVLYVSFPIYFKWCEKLFLPVLSAVILESNVPKIQRLLSSESLVSFF